MNEKILLKRVLSTLWNCWKNTTSVELICNKSFEKTWVMEEVKQLSFHQSTMDELLQMIRNFEGRRWRTGRITTYGIELCISENIFGRKLHLKFLKNLYEVSSEDEERAQYSTMYDTS